MDGLCQSAELTAPRRPLQDKCHQYWPDQGCWTYGNVRVVVEDFTVLVDYTIRKFCIQYVRFQRCTSPPIHSSPSHRVPIQHQTQKVHTKQGKSRIYTCKRSYEQYHLSEATTIEQKQVGRQILYSSLREILCIPWLTVHIIQYIHHKRTDNTHNHKKNRHSINERISV